MSTHRERLQRAFDSRSLLQLVALLDARVVWRGLPDDEQAAEHDEHEDDEGGHHHGPPMCTSREEVREVYVGYLADGGNGSPVVLAEAGDSVVVDPRPEPPLTYPLHQAFTFRGGRVVLIQDYPDRDSALADLNG